MNQTRPKNLNLLTIKFPLPAIVSILHRVSGVILFLGIPLILWLLSYSLTSDGFLNIQSWLTNSLVKLIAWLIMIPFFFHLVAGIRHLLMDVEIGVTLKTARLTSALTFIVSALLIILAGIWIW